LPPELLLLAQICTKSFVGWGFAPDPTGGAYSAPSDPLAALREPTSKGKGREGRGWRGGEGRGEEGKGGGRGVGGRGVQLKKILILRPVQNIGVDSVLRLPDFDTGCRRN